MKLKPGSETKIRRIQKAISARYDNDMIKFRSAAAAVAALESQIDVLRSRITSTVQENSGDILDAKLATKHRSWLETEIKKLNIEMARARADFGDARAQLAASSAKREILEKLQK